MIWQRVKKDFMVSMLLLNSIQIKWQGINKISTLYNLQKIKPQGVFDAILWKLFSRTYNTVMVKQCNPKCPHQRTSTIEDKRYKIFTVTNMIFVPSITGGEECNKIYTSVIEVVRVGQSIISWQLYKCKWLMERPTVDEQTNGWWTDQLLS